MHFVLFPMGSSGDLFPMVGLAIELQNRGHRVTVVTNEHHAPVVKRAGIPYVIHGTSEEYLKGIQNPELWHPKRAFGHVFRTLTPLIRQQYALLEQYHRDSPVVSLSNCFGFGALFAQEKLGVPSVTIHLQPAVLWSRFDQPALPGLFGPRWLRSLQYAIGCRFFINPVACPALNAWRRELSLKPISSVTRFWHSPRGCVGLFPEWFAPVQPDWPKPMILTDFPLWNDGGTQELPRDLLRFLDAGTPPIVFTPGTANIHARAFFDAAAKSCVISGRRGLLLTPHSEQLPKTLPSTMRADAWAPLNLLLPRASAFVHHGGIGSLSQGFAAGVPQIVMPLAHDQFDNAARLEILGCGRSLGVSRFHGPELARLLDELFSSKCMPAALRAVTEHFRAWSGLSKAADAVESLVDA